MEVVFNRSTEYLWEIQLLEPANPYYYGSKQMVEAQKQQRFSIFLLTLDGRLFGSIIFSSYDFIHQYDE